MGTYCLLVIVKQPCLRLTKVFLLNLFRSYGNFGYSISCDALLSHYN